MRLTSISLSLGLLVGSAALAAPEYVPIQERAQGRSLTGANLLNDSLFSNPASSAFTQTYSLEASYLLPKTFSVTVLDTRTSDVGGALGYFRELRTDGTSMQGAKASLSKRATDHFAMGVAGKILWTPGIKQAMDVDMGVLTNVDPMQIGATVHNVFGGAGKAGYQREASIGARIHYDNVLFLSGSAVALVSEKKPYQYGIGTEYVSPYHFAMKGGYWFRPEQSLAAWTAGLSLLSPKLSVHYAVEFPNQKTDTLTHQLSMMMLL